MASGGKEKQKEIAKETAAEAAIDKIEAPNPFQQQIDAQTQKYLNFKNRTGEYAGTPLDVTQTPGLEGVLDLYGDAYKARDEEMYGTTGAGAFSSTANGAYGDQLKMQNQFNRDQAKAEATNRALSALDAQMTGQADASIGRDLNRALNVANLRQTNLNSYYGRPRSVPWWQQALGLAAGGASAASGLGALGWKPFN